jgi:hypothetical protein
VAEKPGDSDSADPTEVFQAHLDLGTAFIDMRRFSDAVRELEIACRMRPDHKASSRLLEKAKAAREEQAKRG